MAYRNSTMVDQAYEYYFFAKNAQGDIVAIYNPAGAKLIEYTYDAWGNTTISYHNGGASTSARYNSLTYRGYFYDSETGLYYLNSRYYDPAIGRFITPDNYVNANGDITGFNMYAYCGNNPVNRIDPMGDAWWHWALGAVVVAVCAAATVVTCGGFAAAATAVTLVAGGSAAATTASTVAAAALIGSATIYGAAVVSAASTSSSVQEFNDQGNWGTVAATAGGALLFGGSAYFSTKDMFHASIKQEVTTGNSKPPLASTPNSRYLQYDQSTGALRSDTVYDANGNWYSRVDYMHPHNIGGIDYTPHIHMAPPLNRYGQPIGRDRVLPW